MSFHTPASTVGLGKKTLINIHEPWSFTEHAQDEVRSSVKHGGAATACANLGSDFSWIFILFYRYIICQRRWVGNYCISSYMCLQTSFLQPLFGVGSMYGSVRSVVISPTADRHAWRISLTGPKHLDSCRQRLFPAKSRILWKCVYIPVCSINVGNIIRTYSNDGLYQWTQSATGRSYVDGFSRIISYSNPSRLGVLRIYYVLIFYPMFSRHRWFVRMQQYVWYLKSVFVKKHKIYSLLKRRHQFCCLWAITTHLYFFDAYSKDMLLKASRYNWIPCIFPR